MPLFFRKRNYSKDSLLRRYIIIITAIGMLFMMLKGSVLAQEIQKVILHTSIRNPIMDEITKEIFSRIGVRYTIKQYPWKRVLYNMKTGKGDGVPFIYFKKERVEFLDFTDPVITTGLAVYFPVDKQAPSVFSTLSDLKPYTIGLVSGYRYCEDFENSIAANEIKIDYAADIELNFKKLAAGRFDCLIESEILVAPYLISGTVDKNKFKTVPNEFCKEKFYFAFSKVSPARAIIPIVNKAIEEMKTDGSMARIMGRE